MAKINDDVMPGSEMVFQNSNMVFQNRETVMVSVLKPISEHITEPNSEPIIVLEPKKYTQHKKYTSGTGASGTGTSGTGASGTGASGTCTSGTGTNARDTRVKDNAIKSKTNNGINLYCYNKDSIDARCCGFCYCKYPQLKKEEQCNVCPNNFDEYWHSGYVQTDDGSGKESDGLCCCLCFPLKFGYFFSCCLGSICNGCINSIRDTNVNYLF
jgi:hypothetical protein